MIRTTLYLPRKLRRALRIAALEEGTSTSRLIKELARAYLKARKKATQQGRKVLRIRFILGREEHAR
jgi:hypothetical protein